MVIAYFTTWGQLLFLFILGAYGVLNSWVNIQRFQRLLAWIAKIDRQLELATGRELNYTRMRTALFIQVIVVGFMTASLSMVNCVVIFSGPESISFWSCCFWFVCFFPILLLSFKEFQFYNMMYVLKSKFDRINVELARYGGSSLLWPKSPQSDLIERISKPLCTMETLRQLMHIYANLADCVELLLRLFAWHLVLLTSASFGVITIQGYNLFAALIAETMHMSSYQLTVIICWIFVQMSVIGINVGTCCMTDKAVSIFDSSWPFPYVSHTNELIFHRCPVLVLSCIELPATATPLPNSIKFFRYSPWKCCSVDTVSQLRDFSIWTIS